MADWWSGNRDTTALARLCAQVDYVNDLQKELQGELGTSDEVQHEFRTMVQQCRAALRSRTEGND
jgi:hypothetical protein